MDVVVDGLMVVQQRRDPHSGSEDLQTYSWCLVGVGGVVGSLAGGFLTQYNATRWCFLIASIVGFLISFSGFLMDKQLEQDSDALVSMSLRQRSKKVFFEVANGLKTKELHSSVLFFILMGCMVPSFSDFLYYY